RLAQNEERRCAGREARRRGRLGRQAMALKAPRFLTQVCLVARHGASDFMTRPPRASWQVQFAYSDDWAWPARSAMLPRGPTGPPGHSTSGQAFRARPLTGSPWPFEPTPYTAMRAHGMHLDNRAWKHLVTRALRENKLGQLSPNPLHEGSRDPALPHTPGGVLVLRLP